jgi:hypothetical protein
MIAVRDLRPGLLGVLLCITILLGIKVVKLNRNLVHVLKEEARISLPELV